MGRLYLSWPLVEMTVSHEAATLTPRLVGTFGPVTLHPEEFHAAVSLRFGPAGAIQFTPVVAGAKSFEFGYLRIDHVVEALADAGWSIRA